MDFFFKNLEAAQQQAKTLSLSASQSAKGFAEQFSEQTKTLAEQAATVSSAAAEQASQKWKEINLQEALQLRAIHQPGAREAGPSTRELQQYAITADFLDFIRSLTYSTFRDFPIDQVPELTNNEGSKALTPWQEKHALLIVQEAKEINELRFVLCPKRMTDTQFWQVYFSLAKAYLPSEAFKPDFTPPEGSEAHSRLSELQRGFRQTFATARETALDWSSKATGSLRPAETSAQLHDLVESHSRDNTPKASASTSDPAARARQVPFAESSSSAPDRHGKVAPEDLDNELEAYLRTIEKAEGSSQKEKSESEEAEDLDQYLSELTNDESGERRPQEEESEDAVDLEAYMQELQGDGKPSQ